LICGLREKGRKKKEEKEVEVGYNTFKFMDNYSTEYCNGKCRRRVCWKLMTCHINIGITDITFFLLYQ